MRCRFLVLLMMALLLAPPVAASAQEGERSEAYPPPTEEVPVTQPKPERPRLVGAARDFAITGSDLIVPAVAMSAVLMVIGTVLVVSTRRRSAVRPV